MNLFTDSKIEIGCFSSFHVCVIPIYNYIFFIKFWLTLEMLIQSDSEVLSWIMLASGSFFSAIIPSFPILRV